MVAVLPPSSWRTVGAAIVMTVLSSRSMISATRTIASTTHRRRKGSACGGTATAGAAAGVSAPGEGEGGGGDMGSDLGSGRSRYDERRSLRTPYVTNDVRVKVDFRTMSPEPPRPRSRRDRPAKAALSREAIIEAGLDILRTEGYDALSMRRVAQKLDTGPASLYVYVANRDELHALLFDAAIGTIAIEETDPARWREQLHDLITRMTTMMAEEFPGIAIMGMAAIPTGDNALRVTESMMSLLRAGGASDQAVAYAGDLISMYATAIAYEQSLYATLFTDPGHEQREIARLAQRFSHVPADRYPTMAAVAPLITRGTGHERFALGLDVLINGLLATPTEGRLSDSGWGATGQP